MFNDDDDDFLLTDIPSLTINLQTLANPTNLPIFQNSTPSIINTSPLHLSPSLPPTASFQLRFDHFPDIQPSPVLASVNTTSPLLIHPFTPSRQSIPKRRSITSPFLSPSKPAANPSNIDSHQSPLKPIFLSNIDTSINTPTNPSQFSNSFPIDPSSSDTASFNKFKLSIRTSTNSQPSTPPNHITQLSCNDDNNSNRPESSPDNDVFSDTSDALSTDSLVLPSIHFTADQNRQQQPQHFFGSIKNPPSPTFYSHRYAVNSSVHNNIHDHNNKTRSPSPVHYSRNYQTFNTLSPRNINNTTYYDSNQQKEKNAILKPASFLVNTTSTAAASINIVTTPSSTHQNSSIMNLNGGNDCTHHKHKLRHHHDDSSQIQNFDVMSNAPSTHQQNSIQTSCNTYNSTIQRTQTLPTHLIDADFPLIDGAPVVLKLSPRNFKHNKSTTNPLHKNHLVGALHSDSNLLSIESPQLPLYNSTIDTLSVDLNTLEKSLFNQVVENPSYFNPPPISQSCLSRRSQRATMTSPVRNQPTSPHISRSSQPTYSVQPSTPQRTFSATSPSRGTIFASQTVSSTTSPRRLASPSRPTTTLPSTTTPSSSFHHRLSSPTRYPPLRDDEIPLHVQHQSYISSTRTGRNSIRQASPTPSFRSTISSDPQPKFASELPSSTSSQPRLRSSSRPPLSLAASYTKSIGAARPLSPQPQSHRQSSAFGAITSSTISNSTRLASPSRLLSVTPAPTSPLQRTSSVFAPPPSPRYSNRSKPLFSPQSSQQQPSTSLHSPNLGFTRISSPVRPTTQPIKNASSRLQSPTRHNHIISSPSLSTCSTVLPSPPTSSILRIQNPPPPTTTLRHQPQTPSKLRPSSPNTLAQPLFTSLPSPTPQSHAHHLSSPRNPSYSSTTTSISKLPPPTPSTPSRRQSLQQSQQSQQPQQPQQRQQPTQIADSGSKYPIPPRSPSFSRRIDSTPAVSSPQSRTLNEPSGLRRSLQRNFSPSPSFRSTAVSSPNISSAAPKSSTSATEDNNITFAQFFQLNKKVIPPQQEQRQEDQNKADFSSTPAQFPNVPPGIVIRGRSKSKQPREDIFDDILSNHQVAPPQDQFNPELTTPSATSTSVLPNDMEQFF